MEKFIQTRNYYPCLDLQKILNFLGNTFLETNLFYNYFPTRFENDKKNYPPGLHIWEEITVDKDSKTERIIGITTPQRKFTYAIQIHPDYNYLLKEMLQWIIDQSIAVKNDSATSQVLTIITLEGFIELENLLKEYGFKRTKNDGFLRIRDLQTEVPDYFLPEGFTIRPLKGEQEFAEYAKAIRETFGHGEWFNSEIVKDNSLKSYYNQELDLVVEAPTGEIASFCTFRIDPHSRITELEPMGTVPKYRKLGLGKVLLNEGCKLLKSYNPSFLVVGGAADNPGANKLYEQTGFTLKGTYYCWEKKI